MKYLDINTVRWAFTEIKACTTNKFWGMLAILSAIDSNVVPGKSYKFNTLKCSRFLESTFIVDNYPEYTSASSTWFVKFSNRWSNIAADRLLNSTPSVYSVAVWTMRKYKFNDDANANTIISEFINKCHLRPEEVRKMFNWDRRDVRFNGCLYSDEILWNQLPILNRVYRNLKADGDTVKAKPGEMSRGPFLQPLYASQDNLDCMILTKFDIDKLYSPQV